MRKLRNIAIRIVKKTGRETARVYLKFKGLTLLSPGATMRMLGPYCIKVIPGSAVPLPEIPDENGSSGTIHGKHTFTSGEVYVWQHELKNGYISKNGSVVVGNKVLCSDWDHRGMEHEFWKKDNRPVKHADTVISLLSYHQDLFNPFALTGYYDFVLMVAAKLSRIKDAIPQEDIRNILITYHPFGGHYEKQYLELLGFNPDNYVDSRTVRLSANRVLFGNSGTWKPNVHEVLSLKKNIERRLHITAQTPASGNRIYISRKGTRVIENEQEVIELLKQYDVIIIEDKVRSVEEQISIFRNASFIIGPHGASFSNIIWCRPGTHLYELFSRSWSPDYFLYLARINNMQYSAYKDDTHADISEELFKALQQNIYISIPKLQASLERIFKGPQSLPSALSISA